jgi:hypothetical protein
MSVTITGSKYGDVALSAVGTTTVTVGSGTFSSGDFARTTPRLVGLFSSAGAFKGISYVRAYVSTTELQLERKFFDPKDGAELTQVSGDILLVSKNWADIATTGIAVSAHNVTVTDRLEWGTSGDAKSVFFHDEGKYVTFSNNDGSTDTNKVFGGVVSQGHLLDFVNGTTYGGCTWETLATNNGIGLLTARSTSAYGVFYNHTFRNNAESAGYGYVGSGADVTPTPPTDWGRLTILDCVIDSLDMAYGPGPMANPTHQLLRKSRMVSSKSLYSILSRILDAPSVDNEFKIVANSDRPLSVFGSDSAGSHVVGSPADGRTTVRDIGNDNYFWRSGGTPSQSVVATNCITSDKRSGADLGGEQTNATVSFRYTDSYINLQAATTGVVRRDGDSTVVSSIVGTGTSWAPVVEHDNWTGYSRNSGYPKGPWTYSFKAYGFGPLSGAIAASTVDLGVAGSADNVAFGGPLIQVPDASVTLSQAAALALTTLPTLDNVYDRTIAWSVTDATNAQYPSLSAYMAVAMGTSLDFGSRNIVIDATAGTAFAVNTGTNTVTIKATTLSAGTKFTKLVTSGTISFVNGAAPSATLPYQSSAGTSVPVTAASIVSGSRVQIYDVTNSVELDNVVIGGGGYVGRLTWTTNKTIRLRAMYCSGVTAKLPVTSIATLTNTGASFLDVQVDDQVYIDAGINGSAVTEFAGDYPNVQIDVTDPDGVTTVPRIYAWFVNNLMTSSGIASFFGGLTADDGANFVINTSMINLKLDNTNVSPVIIGGGRLYHDDGSTVIAAASNSIQMDPDRVYTIETGTSGLTGPESALLADIAPIKAKTDNLPTDPADQSVILAAIPSAATTATAVRTELTTELALIPKIKLDTGAIGAAL